LTDEAAEAAPRAPMLVLIFKAILAS